jgi:hypothetical protein
VLEIYSAPCGTGAWVACDDDSSCGSRRSSWSGVLAAGTYLVAVDGWSSTSAGDFVLTYQHIPLPPDATLLAGNGDYNADTTGLGNDYAGSCGGSTAPDVAYYFVRCDARDGVGAHTCHPAGETNIDTVLYWLGPDGIELACDDDDGTCSLCSRVPSTGTLTLDPGAYYLIMDGYGSASGSYTISVTATHL